MVSRLSWGCLLKLNTFSDTIFEHSACFHILYIKVWANTKKLVPPPWGKCSFFALQFYTLYEQQCSNLRPLLSITFPQGFWKSKKFGHWTSGNGGEKTFKRSEQMKKSVKNFLCRGDFTPIMSKSFQIWDHFFSLLFPKDSENLKSLDIGLREVGAKRRLNGVNKWKNP